MIKHVLSVSKDLRNQDARWLRWLGWYHVYGMFIICIDLNQMVRPRSSRRSVSSLCGAPTAWFVDAVMIAALLSKENHSLQQCQVRVPQAACTNASRDSPCWHGISLHGLEGRSPFWFVLCHPAAHFMSSQSSQALGISKIVNFPLVGSLACFRLPYRIKTTKIWKHAVNY